MTCKEAFAKALDEALPVSDGECGFTPCKDAFAQALDEFGFAEDLNPFKSAVGKIKGMFGGKQGQPPPPNMNNNPFANAVPPGCDKTLSQHLQEGCKAQSPESCPYNKGIAQMISEQSGGKKTPEQAMQEAIGYHNGTNVGQSPDGSAPQASVEISDTKAAVEEMLKDPNKIDQFKTGIPGEESEVVTKIGPIQVNSKFAEAAVRLLNEKAMEGNTDAEKLLTGLKAFSEVGQGGGSEPEQEQEEGYEGMTPEEIAASKARSERQAKEDEEYIKQQETKTTLHKDGKPEEQHQDQPNDGSEGGEGNSNEPTPEQKPTENDKDSGKKIEFPSWQDSDNGIDPRTGKRKETRVNRKTYVDVSNMPFWESIKESWKAGLAGKDIVTDYMKISGKWDKIVGSKTRNTLRNGIAASLDYSQMDRFQGSADIPEDAKTDLQFIREEMEEAKTPAQRWAAHQKFAEWKEKYAKLSNQKTTDGVIKPLENKFDGEVAPASILEDSKDEEADTAFGEDVSKALVDQMKAEGLNVNGVKSVSVGPSATSIELEVPAEFDLAKAKSAKMMEKLSMAAGADVSSIGAVSGKKNTIAVQFSNPSMRTVGFSSIIKGKEWQEKAKDMGIPNAIGKDVNGNDIIRDMSKMPHTIITGATGSGKSVMMDSMIQSEKMAKSPKELRQIICDPKEEFAKEDGSPFLLYPRAVKPKDIAKTISSARKEMEGRIKRMGVNVDGYDETKNEYHGDAERNIRNYNANHPDDQMPFLSIKIDEFAELMKNPEYGEQISNDIDSLLALGRSCGISCTLATQRSDVKSIPGRIQANAPGRITMMAAKGDAKASREAKALKGNGDMIFYDGKGDTLRGRGCFISGNDQKAINAYYRGENVPENKPVGGGDPEGGSGTPTPEPSKGTEGGASPEPSAKKFEDLTDEDKVKVSDSAAADLNSQTTEEQKDITNRVFKMVRVKNLFSEDDAKKYEDVRSALMDSYTGGDDAAKKDACQKFLGTMQELHDKYYDDYRMSDAGADENLASSKEHFTSAAKEWRTAQLDALKDQHLSKEAYSKAVKGIQDGYKARMDAAEKGEAYESPEEKAGKDNGGEKPDEMTVSQKAIWDEFQKDRDKAMNEAEKLDHRERTAKKKQIAQRYEQVLKEIKEGKSEDEILDRLESEDKKAAEAKAAEEKKAADAKQAEADKVKAEKEKAKAEEAKKAEATKAMEKSISDYSRLKDKAIRDLERNIGKNGYTESDFQKDKLALEKKHANRVKDLQSGKSEEDIYKRESDEQAATDKKFAALKKSIRTTYKGKPVAGAQAHVGRGKFSPLDPKEEKEYSSVIPKGWKLDGDKNGAGIAYARNETDGSYGYINPKTKTFTKMVDTSHPDYKGVDSPEAKKAKEALQGAKSKKEYEQLEKTYRNIAYGLDEGLKPRYLLQIGIDSYLGM